MRNREEEFAGPIETHRYQPSNKKVLGPYHVSIRAIFSRTASTSKSSTNLFNPAGSIPARKPSGRALTTKDAPVDASGLPLKPARTAALSNTSNDPPERSKAVQSICSTSSSRFMVLLMEI